MTPKEIFTGMRALLSAPGSWLQYVMAATADGTPVDARSPNAVKFCLHGAFYHVYQTDYIVPLDIYVTLRKYIGEGVFMTNWNDVVGRTQDEVLSLLTSCIEDSVANAKQS